MQSYWRMLKMIRPYASQAVAAFVFMVLFSFFSVFSFTMISPFLKALFLDESPLPTTELAVTGSAATTIAGAPVDTTVAADAVQDADSRDKLAYLEDKMDLFDRAKIVFQDWVESTLMRGTKQESLQRICIIAFVLLLLKNVTCYIQELLMVRVSEGVVRDLRNQLYAKLTAMPLAFYHHHKAGELISRATNDIINAQRCINVSFSNVIRAPIFILMYLTVALILSWKLTLLALTLMPLSVIAIVRIGKGVRRISHLQQEEMARITSNLQETVYGIRVIKAFAREDFEIGKFLVRSQELFKQIFRFNRRMKLSSPLTEQLTSIVGLVLLWYGGSKVFTGGVMAPDLFIVFLFAIFSMVRPLKILGSVNAEIQAGIAAADRIFSVLDDEAEVADPGAGVMLDTIEGRVEFDNVHFSYIPGEPVLRGISLQVAPGEVVALVGSSGSGKSTMVDLIPGFYHPQEGTVRIDGVDLREANLASLRRNLGIVTQEVILFHDSIRDNIAYGVDEVSLEEVRAAARAANADGFIMNLPDGYDTIIGDRGLKLSGGQRQRVSIARAILRNPPLLLLDEATSALDTESEQLVQEAIDHLVQHRTTIVIAHRLSTIQNVDRIYLVERGEIVQMGTHDELLAAGGRYKELYTMQFSR
ncbi:ABC transporter ATP-binding protein [bacterium]|nr:MAG: ABC transporter ATP-binding protein [bacterium]